MNTAVPDVSRHKVISINDVSTSHSNRILETASDMSQISGCRSPPHGDDRKFEKEGCIVAPDRSFNFTKKSCQCAHLVPTTDQTKSLVIIRGQDLSPDVLCLKTVTSMM